MHNGVVNFDGLQKTLDDHMETSAATRKTGEDQSIFYRVKRQAIKFMGFSSHLIVLDKCFIDNKVKILNKRLEQQEFVLQMVAHEMRTPLGIIL